MAARQFCYGISIATGAPAGRLGGASFGALTLSDLPATGTPSGSTFLRGDGTWAAVPAGGGTVTSVGLTAPAAGIGVSGSPVTSAGTITLSLTNDLAALEALSGTNTIYYRSGADTWTAVAIGGGLSFSGGTLACTVSPGTGTVTSVSLTAPAAGVTVSGGPVTTSGSITLALANDLAALEALSGTGYARRTGADAWTLDAAVPAASVSGLAAVATSGSAADLSAGTLPAARMPAHTGDVTSAAGSVALTLASVGAAGTYASPASITTDAKGRVTSVTAGAAAAGVPTGALVPFAAATAPTGYLVCDGSAVSRTTYAALFSVIGTTWGAGDGSATFTLPDLRRRVPVGAGGTGTAVLNSLVGSYGGEESHTLTVYELPPHTHAVPSIFRAAAVTGNNTAGHEFGDSSQGGAGGLTSAAAGSGTAHNTMPPALVAQWIIKT